MDTKPRPEERECVMSTTSPQLYWKVCLINAAVFVFAATLLLFSPATVSSQVTRGEVVVVAIGTLVIVLLNAWLLRNSLAPLDRLIQLMDKTEGDRPGERLPEGGSGVAARVARSINALQTGWRPNVPSGTCAPWLPRRPNATGSVTSSTTRWGNDSPLSSLV